VQPLGLKLVAADAVSDGEVDKAFAEFGERRIDGLIVGSAIFFNRSRTPHRTRRENRQSHPSSTVANLPRMAA
jgi:hypothetical protein